MNEKREHRVPLADRAIQILKALPREGEFVFIGVTRQEFIFEIDLADGP